MDASKAFDLVDHGKLFTKLCHRGLPSPKFRHLINLYSLQEFRVRWGDCSSELFGVSNGVRQGGVLSPVLFAEYLDGLLVECQSEVLVVIGVTCLLVLSAMLMIWFYWLLVHLLSGVCYPFAVLC